MVTAEAKRDDLIQAYKAIEIDSLRLTELKYFDSTINKIGEKKKNIFTKLTHAAAKETENLNAPFRLGVVGMFKAGKSTLLNAFMGRDVLRTARLETTTVLTEIIYADSPENEFGEIEWRDGRIEHSSLDNVLKYTDIGDDVFVNLPEDKQRELQTKIVKIRLAVHSDFLQNLILLDTPGFGGSEIGNVKAMEALDSVDAALVIFDALKTGSEEQIRFADELSMRGREIVAVLNRVDKAGTTFSECTLVSDLNDSEEAIKKYFSKFIVKGKNGNPLIFKSSGKQINAVQKEISALAQIPVANNERQEKLKKYMEYLDFWGMSISSDTDEEKFVLNYIRNHFLSSGTEAKKRKIENAAVHVNSLLDQAVAIADEQIQTITSTKKQIEQIQSENERKIQNEVEARIPYVEGKLEDEVDTQITEYINDYSEAVSTCIDDYADIDIDVLITAFMSKDTLAKELENKIDSIFPRESMSNALIDNISRKSQRILKNEWQKIYGKAVELNAIDSTQISFENISNKIVDMMRTLSAIIATTVTAFIFLIFVPGGFILDLIWTIISGCLSFKGTSRLNQAVIRAKNKARIALKSNGKAMFREIFSKIVEENNKIAKELEQAIKSRISSELRLAGDLAVLHGNWLNARKNILDMKNDIKQIIDSEY